MKQLSTKSLVKAYIYVKEKKHYSNYYRNLTYHLFVLLEKRNNIINGVLLYDFEDDSHFEVAPHHVNLWQFYINKVKKSPCNLISNNTHFIHFDIYVLPQTCVLMLNELFLWCWLSGRGDRVLVRPLTTSRQRSLNHFFRKNTSKKVGYKLSFWHLGVRFKAKYDVT